MAAPSASSLHSLLTVTRASITTFLRAAQTSAASEVRAELAALQNLLRTMPGTQDDLPPRATGHTELEAHLRTLTAILSPKAPALWSKRRWADTLAGVKAVREHIAAYHAAQTTAAQTANSTLYKIPDADAISAWLTHSPDNAHRHAELCFYRHADSCSWLLSSPQCASWLHGDVPWLLCTGEPGTGKTLLTSYLIDRLYTLEQQGVAFFYFNRMDALRQDPCSVLRSILSQLLTSAAAVPPLIAKLYDTSSNPTLSQLQAAIVECGGLFERAWVLIDGLDECAEAHRADILSTLWGLSGRGTRVFVTSTPGVVDLRRDGNTEILDLGALAEPSREERVEDMRAVVRRKMRMGQWRRFADGCAVEEVEKVMGRIVERAAGVFLLAVWLAEYVRSATTEGELQTRSRELPSSVADYYAATMKALMQEGSDPGGIVVLKHVIASPRPLTLSELNHLLRVRGEGSLIDLSYTASYAYVATKGLITATEPRGICRPVHPSLLHFLETSEPNLLIDARKEVLGTYFRLLAAPPGSWGGDEVAKDCYQYAVHNWATHLQAFPDDESLQTVVLDAFEGRPEALGEALRVAMRGRSVLPAVRTGRAVVLHACAYWGLTSLARRVLLAGRAGGGEDGPAIDSVDGYGRTPLSWAAERGSTEVLKALVGAGAALDVACGDYAQPPLCLAAMGGHTATVVALLAAGADPSQASANDQLPLSWAAEHGHEEPVRLLLNPKGAQGATVRVDVNARDNAGRSALDWAVHNAHEPVVRLLVEHKDIEVGSDAVWLSQPVLTPPVPPAIVRLLRRARRAREQELEACDFAAPAERVSSEVEVRRRMEWKSGGGGRGGGGLTWVLPTEKQEWGVILLFWFISLVALGGAWIMGIVFRGP